MNNKAATRIKTDAADHAVPQSLAEVNTAIADIGKAQRERDRIQAEMNDNLATIRNEYETVAKPHAERIAALTKGVQTWCESHRGELTRNGKSKTAKLGAGEISWRMRPPSVTVRGKAAVIQALKTLKLSRFLRIKEDIDKDKVLADPDAVGAVKGISISQREDFVIKPFATQLEEVR